ncbi:hypothetical protein J6590_062616, partial [Homalodisca vitripennis]
FHDLFRHYLECKYYSTISTKLNVRWCTTPSLTNIIGVTAPCDMHAGRGSYVVWNVVLALG